MTLLYVYVFLVTVACGLTFDFSKIIVEDDFTGDESTPFDSRIVGGREATIEEFPHQVSFIVNNSYFCGGIIINETWIMTAAHCAQDVDPSTVVLRAGSTFRKNGTIVPIAEVIPHPEYDNDPFDKDIAVMRTVEPMEFGPTMQPVPLAPLGEGMETGSVIQVSGWGRTQQGAPTIPDHLMAVNMTVVSHMKCKLSYFWYLTENMWCAGNFIQGGESTCQGDSGGAAVQDGVVQGIVSFGRGCGQPLSPSVFAAVYSPSNRNFIKNITGL